MQPRTITIFHSPDADDAFMFYGLVNGKADQPGFIFRSELNDIEALNHLALDGSLEATAISVHAFPYLKDRYAILPCGASMGGKSYGPRLVSRMSFDPADGSARSFAVPGTLTSAALALRLYLIERSIEAELVPMHFEQVQQAVLSGKVDAGLLIHEGQITHSRDGLTTVLDLGKWWWDRHGLPLPLGVNVVRKDLGKEGMQAVGRALAASIDYSMSHRNEAIQYALDFGRGLSAAEADEFIGMYVNERTIDLGEEGERSIRLFLSEARARNLVPEAEPEFISLSA